MEELRCIGCGSILQSTDSKIPGFVPESKLQQPSEDTICRRCFRLKNYNEVLPVSITEDDYVSIISTIGEEDCLIVMLIDIFDIEGSMIPQISRLTNFNDLFIVANKIDLLPKSISKKKVVHRLRKIVADNNLKPVSISLMSAKKNHQIDEIFDEIVERSNGRNIYITGATNVGKSTFINALLKSYADSKKDIITISSTAGTTLDFIKIPFEDRFIIDTPGLLNDNQITYYLSAKAVKAVTPKKPIRPKTIVLDRDNTLFIGGLARIDYIKGWPMEFQAYVSEFVTVHRTKTVNADALYEKQLHQLLSPPYEEDPALELVRHTILNQFSNDVDLILPGLGFVRFKGEATLNVFLPKGVTPYIRESLL